MQTIELQNALCYNGTTYNAGHRLELEDETVASLERAGILVTVVNKLQPPKQAPQQAIRPSSEPPSEQ